MRMLVTYSSKTGNTKKVAEAIAQALHTVSFDVKDAPDFKLYDLVIVGFWIDKGKPNAEARRYIETLHDIKTAFFFTLGAESDSEHARNCTNKAMSYFNNTELMGNFCCQGKISPALINMLKRLPAWFPHGPNPQRIARWEQAATHPDAEDILHAMDYFSHLLDNLVKNGTADSTN